VTTLSQLETQPHPAAADDPGSATCPVCGSADTALVADIPGAVVSRTFHLRRCPHCAFAFVANPCTDYAKIYDEAYYHGRGADPLVDYVFELEHPDQTVRIHEWRGVVERVRSLVTLTPQTRWLDFGCGNGGLVRFARQALGCDVVGTDLGWITAEAAKRGIPILTDEQLAKSEGTFDVVTAIEVLEHVPDPREVLRQIRKMLKPGGLFFYTTGNAAPNRDNLPKWGYVRPDIHLSYYEPATLKRLLEETGFRTQPGTFGPGCTRIIQFKVLKNLGVRKKSAVQSLMPWGVAARVLNKRMGIFDHPIAWAV
jgi:SAM-dependent methyltransferase